MCLKSPDFPTFGPMGCYDLEKAQLALTNRSTDGYPSIHRGERYCFTARIDDCLAARSRPPAQELTQPAWSWGIERQGWFGERCCSAKAFPRALASVHPRPSIPCSRSSLSVVSSSRR